MLESVPIKAAKKLKYIVSDDEVKVKQYTTLSIYAVFDFRGFSVQILV